MADTSAIDRARMEPKVQLRPERGRIWVFWTEFKRNKGAVIGLSTLLVIVVLAVFAPVVAPFPPFEQNVDNRFASPQRAHLMGTDNFGRDIFSRVLHGGRISLRVGFLSIAIASTGGVILGLASGFRGGLLDSVIMRAMDALLAFPGILLALVIIAILHTGLNSVMIAVGISQIPTFARVVRGQVLAEREQTYVEAARVVGCTDTVIMYRHLLPSLVPSLIVLGTLGIAQAILIAASLSFIGMGAAPPTPEWGAMLSAGRDYIRYAWWIATFPGSAILVVTLAINMFGDGLRDALDPRLRGR